MRRKTVAIVGFGDLGERLTGSLSLERWRCVGLRRTANAVPAGVESIAVDLRDPGSLAVLEQLQADALVITLSPTQRTAAGYHEGFAQAMAAIVAGLGRHRPRRAFFVSSTRVYREAAGAWVDESSSTADQDPHVKAILLAEQRFLEAVETGIVLRAGGLYGHGPGPLLKRVAAGKLSPVTPVRYGNRIHRDDVAGFMALALNGQLALNKRIINLVDDAPVPLQEMEAWLCNQLGLPYEPPPGGSDEKPVAAHKRIRNACLHASGYALQYPDFRSGYAAVLHRWMAHSDREDGLDLH